MQVGDLNPVDCRLAPHLPHLGRLHIVPHLNYRRYFTNSPFHHFTISPFHHFASTHHTEALWVLGPRLGPQLGPPGHPVARLQAPAAPTIVEALGPGGK